MQKNRNWATILFEKILSDQYTFKSAIGMFQKNVFAIRTFSQLDASRQRKNIYSLFMRWYKRACGPLDLFLQESWCIDLVYSGVPAGPVGVPSWSNCQPASRHAIIVPWCGWALGTMQSMNLSTTWHLYLDGGKFHFWFIWKSQLSRNVITSKKSIWKIHINMSSIFVICVLFCNYCKISKRSYLIRWRRCFRMRPPQTAEWISRILGARVPPRLIYDSLWITSYGSAWEKRKKKRRK